MKLFDRMQHHIGSVPPRRMVDSPSVHRAGYADRCPNCGGQGYLDRIDMRLGTQRQHCRQCGHEWGCSLD